MLTWRFVYKRLCMKSMLYTLEHSAWVSGYTRPGYLTAMISARTMVNIVIVFHVRRLLLPVVPLKSQIDNKQNIDKSSLHRLRFALRICILFLDLHLLIACLILASVGEIVEAVCRVLLRFLHS